MDQEHSDLPKYEVIAILANVEAVKIKPEVFITQEHFEVPIPKQLTAKTLEPPAKKSKGDIENIMSYDKFVEVSKEDEICTLAYWKDPPQPRPKTAAIRYRYLAVKQEETDVVTIDPEDEDEF